MWRIREILEFISVSTDASCWVKPTLVVQSPPHRSFVFDWWEQKWKQNHKNHLEEKRIMSSVVTAGFCHTKINSEVCMTFYWPTHAAQQQTTESWRGPSGELNVSCCANHQENNSSSRCTQSCDKWISICPFIVCSWDSVDINVCCMIFVSVL